MKRDSCIEQLKQYLKENKGWHKKVHLFVLGDEWGFSPETIGRKLRNLEELKEIHVEYYDGKYSKGLAKYCYEKPPQLKVRYEVKDGIARKIEYYE